MQRTASDLIGRSQSAIGPRSSLKTDCWTHCHSNASLSNYVAFFEDQSLGLFFSPCTNHGNELVHTQYRWFPMSWKVDKTEASTSDEEPVLQCHGLQRGAWIAEESWSERVIIS